MGDFEGEKLLWTCACVVLLQTNHIIELKNSIWNENQDLSTNFDWQLHTALCRIRLITCTVCFNVAAKYPYAAAFTKYTETLVTSTWHSRLVHLNSSAISSASAEFDSAIALKHHCVLQLQAKLWRLKQTSWYLNFFSQLKCIEL